MSFGIYLWENEEIEAFLTQLRTWSMPVRQFSSNLQMRGAFIAAFTSEKQ
jgi:hypothetical protein